MNKKKDTPEYKGGEWFIESRGGMLTESGGRLMLMIWQLPPKGEIEDGHAYEFSMSGEKSVFAWAWPNQAELLDIEKLPEGFLYSVQHGMSKIYCPMQDSNTLAELIEKSDWLERKVTPSMVAMYSHDKEVADSISIETIEDFHNNFEILRTLTVIPYSLIDQILAVHGIHIGCQNGEIGIAAFQKNLAFSKIILDYHAQLMEKKEM